MQIKEAAWVPPRRQLDSIEFSVLEAQTARRISLAELTSPDLYQMQRPVLGGPLDPRLGVGNKANQCQTCGHQIDKCVGHFGSLQLALPMFHPLLFRQTLNSLKCLCKRCGLVLLPDQAKFSFMKKMRRLAEQYQHRQSLFKRILVECRKNEHCASCGYSNPKVLKVSKMALRIQLVFEHHQGKEKKSQKYDFSPLQAYNLLKKVRPEEAVLLNLGCAPESLLLTVLPVPPVCIRPSLLLNNNLSNEDDLTIKMRQIFIFNKRLQNLVAEGQDYVKLEKDWYLVNAFVAQYMNSDMSGLQIKELGKKAIRSFCVRLKGKEGRFRQNLSGKRSNFTGRTVISPDPNIRLNEVVVPEFMAKILTVSEPVSRLNLGRLAACVKLGNSDVRGANFVVQKDGSKVLASYARELQIGDVVERHLSDGDIVIFNRQPSLHRISMMGFRVRVRAGNTLRFNECVCAPFNADFDGDEMNIHVPQTLEAQVETEMLMGLDRNIMSPKNGEPIVALIQDFITSAFVMSDKDVFLTRQQLVQCFAALSDASEHFDLPPPAISKPVQLWTGKQVISSLLRPNRHSRVIVNFSLKEKRYESGDCMCPKDGFVLVRNSELLCGQIGKPTVGGNKKGLLYALIRDNGMKPASLVMSRFAKLAGRWLSNYGFTIGLIDVTPSASLRADNEGKIAKAVEECVRLKEEYSSGRIKSEAGKTPEQVLEHLTNYTLSKVRQTVGDTCTKLLHKNNMPLVMSVCGAKGSPINLSQMIGCLGQQTVGGKRISNGYTARTLPHFRPGAVHPLSKGFVRNSFYSGLTAIEFFFHTMGGREGLIDTAVKTAETGYMQRRLIKLLEDVSVMYDQTVRSCDRMQLIQLRYGEDGLNPMFTEDDAVNLPALQAYVKAIAPARRGQPFLSQEEFHQQYRAERECFLQQHFKRVDPFIQNKFFSLIDSYVEGKKKAVAEKLAKSKSREFALELTSLTGRQVRLLVRKFGERATKAIMEPGESVGAVTAQSIGEPATQMTLKTFHFAGISSMNITQGVPRMNEIINASANIATPIIQIKLTQPESLQSALAVQRLIEVTFVKDICDSIKEVYSPSSCYLDLIFDAGRLAELELTPQAIGAFLLSQKLGLKKEQLQEVGKSGLRITARGDSRNQTFELRLLKKNLPEAMVKGFKGLSRVLVSKDGAKHNLFAEGRGLGDLLGVEGVDYAGTKTNHILQIESVLGIEAAKRSVINEISATMKEHGVSIDTRHIFLLSEIMCWRGKVTSFNRYGVDKLKDSTLMLASFQKTADFLFDAASMGKLDRLRGSSERIIVGRPIKLGTGSFELFWGGQN